MVPVSEGAPTRLEHLEVDGVPVVRVDSDGPTSAVLVFRSGFLDEALPLRGVGHLVEHLAMRSVDEDVHANAQVSLTTTRFWARGEPDQVVASLHRVVESLADLDVGRLEEEARVLRTEAVGRGRSPLGQHLLARYGRRGPGLLDETEHLLEAPDPRVVRRWAARRLVRENAALVVGGQVPAGLRLDGLETGRHHPVPPAPDEMVQLLPCWEAEATENLLLGVVVHGADVASALASVWQRRLVRRLRRDESLSYAPNVAVTLLRPGLAALGVEVDALPEVRERALELVLAELRRVADDGPGPKDLAGWVARVRHGVGDPDGRVGLADLWATDDLLGGDLPDQPADWLDGLEEIRSDEVADAAGRALDRAVLLLPHGLDGPAGWMPRHLRPRRPPHGDGWRRARRILQAPDDLPGGIAVLPGRAVAVENDGRPTQALDLDEVVAVSAADNGCRQLLLLDGGGLTVLPWTLEGGPDLVADLDRQLDGVPRLPWRDPPAPPPQAVPDGPRRTAGEHA